MACWSAKPNDKFTLSSTWDAIRRPHPVLNSSHYIWHKLLPWHIVILLRLFGNLFTLSMGFLFRVIPSSNVVSLGGSALTPLSIRFSLRWSCGICGNTETTLSLMAPLAQLTLLFWLCMEISKLLCWQLTIKLPRLMVVLSPPMANVRLFVFGLFSDRSLLYICLSWILMVRVMVTQGLAVVREWFVTQVKILCMLMLHFFVVFQPSGWDSSSLPRGAVAVF